MEKIYNEEDLIKAKAQKNKIKTIYFCVMGVYLAIAIALFVLYVFQPYKSPNIIWIKIPLYVLSGIFVIFSFIYIGIPMKRLRVYNKIINGIMTGSNNTTIGNFDRFSETLEAHYGIEFKTLYFLEYNTKKQDFFERKVLFDIEKQFPDFKPGENIKFYTHGNILVGYEKI